jgi:serine/threonine-protein kinase
VGEDFDELAMAKRRLGTVLRDKYKLESILGVGGMAVVYKATHRNQAEFAVKMLHPTLSIHPEICQRFLREGYAANSVKHPGAVLVVDDDTAEDGSAFLVMEMLDGAPLQNLWEAAPDKRLAPKAVAAITLQLLDVLVAAHAKDIVHRDIKPANLFITRDGSVKVLDFGIARARDARRTALRRRRPACSSARRRSWGPSKRWAKASINSRTCGPSARPCSSCSRGDSCTRARARSTS